MAPGDFEPGGSLSRLLPGFEARPSQASMAAAVDGVLQDGGVLVVEAGTGTGKGLAYLLPALKRSADEGERLLISTHTLNLQSQLLEADLPLALKALDMDAEVSRAMGRGNYLCRLRLELAGGGSGELFATERSTAYKRLHDWAADEARLTRDAAPFKVPPEVWEQVQVEAYGCLGNQCPYARDCHFLGERQRLQGAQVVVANHALLMADVAARREGNALLPDAGMLIVDEAHHLERVAGEHLGLRVSRSAAAKLLGRLYDARAGKGLALAVDGDGKAAELAGRAQHAADGFFRQFAPTDLGRERAWELERAGKLEDPLSQVLMELSGRLDRQATQLKEAPEKAALSSEATAMARRLEGLAQGLRDWLAQDGGESVFWVEGQRADTLLRSAPLDVGGRLSSELFARHRASVLTSATLTVQGSFDFAAGRLGLEEARTLALPPAFDYLQSVEMHLSTRLPDPRQDEAGYLEALEEGIRSALDRSAGRAFVLFTSFNHLRHAAGQLQDWIEAQGWDFMEQGAGRSRERLLEDFRRSGKAVLFGAASFWEGVDVPGEALSCVVVCRLPFTPPDSPWEKARQDRVKAKGGDPFRDLSLPEAVLRLKQGFGRLIRHSTDTGHFVLLDPRILAAPYGRAFLRSLPPCRLFVDGERAQGPWPVPA